MTSTGVTTYTVFKLVFLIFLGLGIAVHFDTEVVSTLLPMHLCICYVKQVAYTQLITAGDINKSDSGWRVGLFWYPVGYNVVRW